MNTFWWILLSTFAMSLVSCVGLLVLFFREALLKKIILLLVAFSAGALIGGAFLHMIPESLNKFSDSGEVFLWVVTGFSLFFLLEQFIHWHHCHNFSCEHDKPVAYLVLIADGLHNFIGGLTIAGAFLIDIRIGIITWLVAAAHEIPQELGDFGILIHSGWKKTKALLFNSISAFTVVIGGLVAFFLSSAIDLAFLLPFAAGNFIYIASSDLIPEVKGHENLKTSISHFAAFIAGILLVMLVGLIEL